MKFVGRALFSRAASIIALSLFVGLFVTPLHAALTIEIIGAGSNQIPIAIVPFRSEDGLAQKVTPIVASDLTRSGLFRMVDPGGVNPPPHDPQDVNYGTWRARGSDAVVIGS